MDFKSSTRTMASSPSWPVTSRASVQRMSRSCCRPIMSWSWARSSKRRQSAMATARALSRRSATDSTHCPAGFSRSRCERSCRVTVCWLLISPVNRRLVVTRLLTTVFISTRRQRKTTATLIQLFFERFFLCYLLFLLLSSFCSFD